MEAAAALSEEEKLVKKGLRDEKFFGVFGYDDQTAEWVAAAAVAVSSAAGCSED